MSRLVTEPGLRRDTALTLPMDWLALTGDPTNKANPGLSDVYILTKRWLESTTSYYVHTDVAELRLMLMQA